MATSVHLTASSPNPVPQPRLHLAFLDGLRAVAALLVVVSHLWGYYMPHYSGASGILTNWLSNGRLWVDVFIVLSGFCLMLPVTRSGTLRGGWITFYKSRARRILPPLYAAVGFAILKTTLAHHQIPLRTILVNVFMLQDLVGVSPVLDGPLWSVAVEWKIYFLFPALVWLWTRFGYTASFIFGAFLSAVVTAFYIGVLHSTDMTYCSPWYIFLFALGTISADFACQIKLNPHAQRTAWIILSAALILDWVQAHLWPTKISSTLLQTLHLPIADSLNGLVVSALLFLLAHKAISGTRFPLLTPVFSLLTWQPLVFIGTFSYSIYLIHNILIYVIEAKLVALLHNLSIIFVFLVDIAVVVTLAYAFYLAFERPFMSKPGNKIKTEKDAEIAAAINPAP